MRSYYFKASGYSLIVILLACLMEMGSFVNLFVYGPFAGKFLNLNNWWGLISIASLLFLSIIVHILGRRRRLSLIIAMSSYILLAYLYSIWLPVILVLLYFETTYAIGVLFNQKYFHQGPDSERFYIHLISGFLCIGTLLCLFSLIGFGSIHLCKYMLLIFGPFAIFFNRSNLLLTNIYHYCQKIDRKSYFILIAFGFFLIFQMSRSNIAFDYDSLWYGLQSDKVLIPSGTIYQKVGMLQFPHYYPKLVEILTLPVYSPSEYSFVYVFNSFFLALLFATISSIARLLSVDTFGALLIAFVVVSIPAVGNLASTAKTDICTSVFVLWAMHIGIRIYIEEDFKTIQLSYFVGTLLMSMCMKYTSILYLPALLVTFVFIFRRRFIRRIALREITFPFYIVVGIALSLFFLVHFRTLSLTGYPTYPFLADKWNYLGFEGIFPFNLFQKHSSKIVISSLSDIALGLYRYNFDPKFMEHVIVAWPGNILLFCLIMLGVKTWGMSKLRRAKLLLITLPLLLEYIALRLSYLNGFSRVYGGDGNYLMIPVTILLSIFLSFLLINARRYRVMVLVFFIFLIFQLLMSYFSHWSWKSGLHMLETKDRFHVLDSKDYIRQHIFVNNGAEDIHNYLSDEKFKNSLGLLYTKSASDRRFINKPWPIRLESFGNAFKAYGIFALTEDSELLRRYIESYNVDLLIVENGASGVKSINDFISMYSSDFREVIRFNMFTLYLLR